MTDARLYFGRTLQADGVLSVSAASGILKVRCLVLGSCDSWSIEANLDAEVVELLRVALASAEKGMKSNV
jgi:hypothetical protein